MFVLGVIVGQKSSPVLFETRPFQERLGRMVSKLSADTPEKEKVDLKFYDVLDEPVYHPVKGKTADSGEITPGPAAEGTAPVKHTPEKNGTEEFPVKRSKKLATWHQAGQGRGDNVAPAPLPKKKTSPVKTDTKSGKKQAVTKLAPKVLKPKKQVEKKTDTAPVKSKPDKKKENAPAVPADNSTYTIQIASYKQLNDALAQMVLLSEKGITSYRASVKINGDTWYRVRTGAFSDYETAKARLAKLADSGVNGMVIKKD